MTHAPSTYKIHAVSDAPATFNVELYRNDNAKPTIFRSKAVGEPLLLSFSVLLAICAAIAASKPDSPDAPQAARTRHARSDSRRAGRACG